MITEGRREWAGEGGGRWQTRQRACRHEEGAVRNQGPSGTAVTCRGSAGIRAQSQEDVAGVREAM